MVKRFVPRFIKRTIRGLVSSSVTQAGIGPADKHDWEFWWQQTHWLEMWRQPEIQTKCLEYWVRFRHYDDIRNLVPIGPDSDILDIGCGLSSVLHFLPGRRTGVDPLGTRYRSVYDYPFEVVAAPGEALPFADASFDVAFSSNAIDHTTDPEGVISEVHRVLRPGGHFVLTCEVFSENLGERNAGHPHSMTAEAFRTLAGRHFEELAFWSEPWYGMHNYCLGGQPTSQREHIVVLKTLANR